MNIFEFPKSFILLQQEGYLISSCLSMGLTELRSANVHNKGSFYSSLFNLSVGIERLLKAIVIIDHMIKNELSVPTKKRLKEYGHDIVELYDTCVSIANERKIEVTTRDSLDNVSSEILGLLSDFAQTTRYHNLDSLSSPSIRKDPLFHWAEIISLILERDVPVKQREKIMAQAKSISSAIEENTMTIMQGLDQKALTTEEALALPGLHDQAVKYAVLNIINMLSQLRSLVSELSHQAYAFNSQLPPFPQMQEFLEWVWNDRQYVLRKKRWP